MSGHSNDGVMIQKSFRNWIWWNNFFGTDTAGVIAVPPPLNDFELPLPFGGNYWKDHQGGNCVDLAPRDNICDAPYNFPGDSDSNPRKLPIPWQFNICFYPIATHVPGIKILDPIPE